MLFTDCNFLIFIDWRLSLVERGPGGWLPTEVIPCCSCDAHSLFLSQLQQEDDEVLNERQAVEGYLKFNELEEVLNGILNELVTDRPTDPYLSLR